MPPTLVSKNGSSRSVTGYKEQMGWEKGTTTRRAATIPIDGQEKPGAWLYDYRYLVPAWLHFEASFVALLEDQVCDVPAQRAERF